MCSLCEQLMLVDEFDEFVHQVAQSQIYHEVDVAVLPAEILHELLEATFLSTHLKNIKGERITGGTRRRSTEISLFVSKC